jgi:hypothetical protein
MRRRKPGVTERTRALAHRIHCRLRFSYLPEKAANTHQSSIFADRCENQQRKHICWERFGAKRIQRRNAGDFAKG